MSTQNLENACVSGRVFQPWSLLNANPRQRSCVFHACESMFPQFQMLWTFLKKTPSTLGCVCETAVIIFVLCLCAWQFGDLFCASTNWLFQLFQISYLEEVSLCECWFHHAGLLFSMVHQYLHVQSSAAVWKHAMITVCMISRMTVIYCGGSFTAHPPLFNFSSCTLFPSLNLHGLSFHMWIWNVNDRPEGQKEKVAHFRAILNMQISRQISGSCSQRAHN